MENFESSDGHGHDYHRYLAYGAAGGRQSVVVLLCAGGACYILGAIVYALRKPDPWPRVFGFHEIFHCGTVAGYACHMVAIYMVIVSLWQ